MQGSIEIICGPMFAGKSSELIRRARVAQEAGLKIKVFKPQKDTRYSNFHITSHNGDKIPATPISYFKDISEYLDSKTNIIALDEVHFFKSSVSEAIYTCTDLANEGYKLIISGIDQDFRGEPIHPLADLLAIAEKITKLKAYCSVCGEPAHQSQRLINNQPAPYDSPTIQIGAKELYEPRCRKCHQIIRPFYEEKKH
jgi:thymidine kinase